MHVTRLPRQALQSVTFGVHTSTETNVQRTQCITLACDLAETWNCHVDTPPVLKRPRSATRKLAVSDCQSCRYCELETKHCDVGYCIYLTGLSSQDLVGWPWRRQTDTIVYCIVQKHRPQPCRGTLRSINNILDDPP